MPGSGEKAAGSGGAEKRKYPIGWEDYELYEEVGQGASAIVYRALCKPLDEIVAIKVLDFERTNSDLNNIMREAQTMILIDHPNVVKAHCSFAKDQTLWVVMPYMAGGSCLHIMKSVYPTGFEEAVIATVLREVLKGLEYLHHHGHIHRDVKAGNILVDSRGGIKLADFGVSACLFDSGDRQRPETPLWELLAGWHQKLWSSYMDMISSRVLSFPFSINYKRDFLSRQYFLVVSTLSYYRADIWSFGITALELAHGNAPFSKYPPMKVLLMTLQNAPPGLDLERDKKFSRSFKQMVAMCLVKDPSKRPTAKKLLKQPFFKQARSSDFISRKLFEGLPGLGARYQALKDKDEDLLAQKKIPDGKKEELSQDEYKRGISSWNFDMDDLKSQASLVTECDDSISCKDSDALSFFNMDSLQEQAPEGLHLSRDFTMKYDIDTENDLMANDKSDVSSPEQSVCLSRNGFMHGTANGMPVNSVVRKDISMESCDLVPQEKDFETIPSETSPEAVSKAPKSAVPNVEEHDDRAKPPLIQQRGRFKVTPGHVELDKVLYNESPTGPTKVSQYAGTNTKRNEVAQLLRHGFTVHPFHGFTVHSFRKSLNISIICIIS
ncbi:hypothetical protein PR202_ga03016 [Eleusine coracana subsp. coracana]|uniref:Protein kinase domain-containing protein n=1 Tax=Eleusine coracana subsp. coracana TaxID=191504 RepID=A0AAV5BLJ5_ELECO|nr:hypothetical protein PR202_ga03016 [Eleusine coracana subsp. coracana]